MSSIFEKEIVSKLQSGNLGAFDTLYHIYSPRLFSFAFSLLKNNEDAEEIVQEVFLILWKKRNKIDLTKSFKSYLFTISHNLIIDQLRKRLNEKKYQFYLERYFNLTTDNTTVQATDYAATALNNALLQSVHQNRGRANYLPLPGMACRLGC